MADTDNDIIAAIVTALTTAEAEFPPFYSNIDGWATIDAEMDELRDSIKEQPRIDDYADMRIKAIQIAAMAIRFVKDLC